jgi:hypothetical protein
VVVRIRDQQRAGASDSAAVRPVELHSGCRSAVTRGTGAPAAGRCRDDAGAVVDAADGVVLGINDVEVVVRVGADPLGAVKRCLQGRSPVYGVASSAGAGDGGDDAAARADASLPVALTLDMSRTPVRSTATARGPFSAARTAGPPSPSVARWPVPTMVLMLPVARSRHRTRSSLTSAISSWPLRTAIPFGSRTCARSPGPPSPEKPGVPVPAAVVMTPDFASARRIRAFSPSTMNRLPRLSSRPRAGGFVHARRARPPDPPPSRRRRQLGQSVSQ